MPPIKGRFNAPTEYALQQPDVRRSAVVLPRVAELDALPAEVDALKRLQAESRHGLRPILAAFTRRRGYGGQGCPPSFSLRLAPIFAELRRGKSTQTGARALIRLNPISAGQEGEL